MWEDKEEQRWRQERVGHSIIVFLFVSEQYMKIFENLVIFLSFSICDNGLDLKWFIWFMFHNEAGYSFLLLKNRRPFKKLNARSVQGVVECHSDTFHFFIEDDVSGCESDLKASEI